MARGHYDERVEVPAVEELAALATDVNELALTLDETETRRARLILEVTHELRTPLTSIDGYVEGAMDGVFSTEEISAEDLPHVFDRSSVPPAAAGVRVPGWAFRSRADSWKLTTESSSPPRTVPGAARASRCAFP
jgi:signal transduction histidine kinase